MTVAELKKITDFLHARAAALRMKSKEPSLTSGNHFKMRYQSDILDEVAAEIASGEWEKSTK